MKKLLYIIIILLIVDNAAFGLGGSPEILPDGPIGFGTETRAAYGGTGDPAICIVDELGEKDGSNDLDYDAASYTVPVFKGSLWECVEGLDTTSGGTYDGGTVAAGQGKIILFEVSGTIQENGDDADNNDFTYQLDNYTSIYGQTAPSPGITLRNLVLRMTDVHDILIQHLRGRMDGPPSVAYGVHKSFFIAALNSEQSAYNIVLDHLSSSWGADGNITIFRYASSGIISDITISNCIIAEGRENMGLSAEEANNSKNSNVSEANDVLFFGNLISNSRWRSPRIDAGSAVILNNYIYNNKDGGTMIEGDDYDLTAVSIVANVQEGGPMSGTYTSLKYPNFGLQPWTTPLTDHNIYLFGNISDSGSQANSSDWLAPEFQVDVRKGNTTVYADVITNETFAVRVTGETPADDAPLWPTSVSYVSAANLKTYITQNVGAWPAARDALDARLINEMNSDSGPSSPVDGAPSSAEWTAIALDANGPTAVSIPASPHTVQGSGYTNLEEWIHGTNVETPIDPLVDAGKTKILRGTLR